MTADLKLEDTRSECIKIFDEYLVPIAKKLSYQELITRSNIKAKPTVVFIGEPNSGVSSLIKELFSVDSDSSGNLSEISIYINEQDSDSLNQNSIEDLGYDMSGSLLGDLDLVYKIVKTKSGLLKNMNIIGISHSDFSDSAHELQQSYHKLSSYFCSTADILVVVGKILATDSFEFYKFLSQIREFISSDKHLFVLNKIDRSSSVEELIGKYGSFCWNIGKSLGGKKSPPVFLTYLDEHLDNLSPISSFIKNFSAHKIKLTEQIIKVSEINLAKITEVINSVISQIISIENIISFWKKKRLLFCLKYGFVGTLFIIVSIVSSSLYFIYLQPQQQITQEQLILGAVFSTVVISTLWQIFVNKFLIKFCKKDALSNLDSWVLHVLKEKSAVWENIAPYIRKSIENDNIAVLSRGVKHKIKNLRKINLDNII
jgi:hypothetical protein